MWGYEKRLAILADPTHREHAERVDRIDRIDRIGDEFDPDEFDLELANTVLAARFRQKSPPTDRPHYRQTSGRE